MREWEDFKSCDGEEMVMHVLLASDIRDLNIFLIILLEVFISNIGEFKIGKF